MENFLKQLRLSDESIAVYLKCIERMPQSPLSFKELQAILPNTSPENLENLINELLSVGLLIHVPPKKPELLTYFLATPPIAPILNYYANINENLPNIKNAVQEFIKNSLSQILQSDTKIDLDPILKEYEKIKKDINEDMLIQKQDLQETVKELDVFKDFKNVIEEFSQQMKSLVQTKFSDLLKTPPHIKESLVEKVHALELKKAEIPVTRVIEEVFKEKTEEMVKEFNNSLTKSVEDKFNSIHDPLNEILKKMDQTKNNFTMLYTNLLTNFEKNFISFQGILSKNKDNFSNNLKTLEKKVTDSFNEIIQNSINQISGLNKPMEEMMQKYSQTYLNSERIVIDNLWSINTKYKILEEMSNAISTSRQELFIIVPKIFVDQSATLFVE